MINQSYERVLPKVSRENIEISRATEWDPLQKSMGANLRVCSDLSLSFRPHNSFTPITQAVVAMRITPIFDLRNWLWVRIREHSGWWESVSAFPLFCLPELFVLLVNPQDYCLAVHSGPKRENRWIKFWFAYLWLFKSGNLEEPELLSFSTLILLTTHLSKIAVTPTESIDIHLKSSSAEILIAQLTQESARRRWWQSKVEFARSIEVELPPLISLQRRCIFGREGTRWRGDAAARGAAAWFGQ